MRRYWLLAALAASLSAPGMIAAQEAPDDGAIELVDDTDLDKDDAEAGRDITNREGLKDEADDKVVRQALKAPDDAPPGFQTQVDDYHSGYTRYSNEIVDFQATVESIVDAEYKRKVAQINGFYDSKINASEAIERAYRDDAILAFEQFLERFPNEERYTPDALFRLAELYFEKANDDFLLADDEYQIQLDAYERGERSEPPEDVTRDYTLTIATFQRLIDAWPDYRLLDGAIYLVGYCQQQMGEDALARDLFAKLIVDRPDSKFVPEAWVRIGEHHFDYNELDLAKAAYEQAMLFPDSAYYDKALYKLAWTYYRQDDFHQAIAQFKRLVEWSDEHERQTGREGSVLREEAVQYVAISLAEEDWDLDGEQDADFGLVRVQRYITGDAPYEREVLAQVGNYLFDNARYTDAVDVFNFQLRKYPLDRNNPEIHEKLILALLRDEKLDTAFAERSKLNQYYGAGSDWLEHQHKIGNAEAVRYSEDLVKDNLIQSATWYHSEAQKARDRALAEENPAMLADAREKYTVAAAGYQDFLKKYPNDKDFYQWNFYWAECLYYSGQYAAAFQQYRAVREMDVANNEFQEVAGFNAVKAMEERVTSLVQAGELPAKVLPRAAMEDARSAAESQEEAREDVDERGEQKSVVQADQLQPVVYDYVTAMDRYVVLGLKNADDPALDAKFAFTAAKVYYDYNDYDTARTRFGWIVNNYPEDEVAYLAGSLILETYRNENDFPGLAAAAERLGNVIKGEQAEAIKAEVRTLQLGALFKSAEQAFAAGEYELAASEYLKLIAENPDTEHKAKALNNAAVAYENVRRFESAMRLYERVYKEHPRDPLATYALYRVAVNQERFFDFEAAIQSYEVFYDRSQSRTPAEMAATGLDFDLREKQSDALLNAAILRENLQKYPEAARGYERFVSEKPNDARAADTAWQAALVWEKANDQRRMSDAIESYIRRFGNGANQDARVLEGIDKIAQYHEGRNSRRNADQQYKRAIDEYQRRGIRPGTPAAFFAAKAQFMLVEREYEDWAKMRIAGNLNQQQRQLKQKIEGQQELNRKYEEVWNYGSLEWTMASSYRKGKLMQEFAASLYEVPVPFAEGSEQYDIYRTQLEDLAIPLEDEAIAAYEATITKAREEKIVNEWTKRALEELNSYKPAEFPMYHDEQRVMQRRRSTGRDFLDADALQQLNSPPAPQEPQS